MSLLAPTWVSAGATLGLFVGAVITAIYAGRAFGKQTEEVRTLQKQAKDAADLLQIQSGQLSVLRDQFAEQRNVNEKQTEVLGLQAQELREALGQREREAERAHRAQARQVFIWEEYRDRDPRISQPEAYFTELTEPGGLRRVVVAHVQNTSQQPIYGLTVRWHKGPALHGERERKEPLMPGDEHTEIEPLPPGVAEDVFGAVAWFLDCNGTTWRLKPGPGRLDEAPVEDDAALPRPRPRPELAAPLRPGSSPP